ncbi:MAG: hypothetical protein RL154_1504 [Pseudomonadota bacterium]|jgi:molybdopterin-guanine dinucleotide biosynthesis protein B
MKSKIVAFTGPSNSGKTTIIEKLVLQLAPNYRVAVIKHDPKDKAIFDISGKDSHKFFTAGANVCVISPSRATTFKRTTFDFEEAINSLKPFDYLFVEGLKEWAIPRIGIFRNSFDKAYCGYLDALAIDDSVKNAPRDLTKLNLNQPNDILEWINQHAKEI